MNNDNPTKPDPKHQALTFIEIMCNKRDFDSAATYLTPDMIQYHDDRPPIRGAATFVAGFKRMTTEIAPGFHITVLDAVSEGNKVWAFVRISGLPGGDVKEGIDMTVWSDEGKLVSSRDVQRVVDVEAAKKRDEA